MTGVQTCALPISFLMRGCNAGGDRPKIPPATQKTIDSLIVMKPAFVHTQDSLKTVVVRDTQRAMMAEKAARLAIASAQRARSVADSFAQIARTVTDAGQSWHTAYDERTVEADNLRVAVAQKDSAYRDERDARQGLQKLYVSDTLRRVVVEKVVVDLTDAIKHLQQPCRIVGPVPCPSRTVTFVLAGIGGALVGHKARP